MFKKVIFNTGAQILGKAITSSITLLITLIIGRSLGPQGYGDFTKIFVFVAYFHTLVDFGLNQIYIKIAKENETKDLRTLFGLRIIMGIALAILAASIAQFLPYDQAASTGFSPQVKLAIAIASITIITQALITSSNAFFQKILRLDLSTVAATTGYVFIFTTAVIVTITSRNLLGYTFAYVLGGIVLVSTSYLLIVRRTEFFLPKFQTSEFLIFLKSAWPVGLALIFNLIYFRIDVFILSNFRSTQEVGLYGLSYQFFEAALAIPIFFSNAIYPPLSSLYKKDMGQFNKQVKSWIKILLASSALVSAALFAAAYLIPVIYDQRFAGSVQALQVLSLGMPFFFISALLWHLLIIFGRQKYLTAIYASGALFNVAANLILIPIYGYMAAAVMTVLSEALITGLLAYVVIQARKEKKPT